MEIIVKQLTMRNFKGVQGERTVKFSPTVTKVYGANRTGKTTIADAFRWCLFGKNTEGKADFGIKTKDAAGEVIPELSHEVSVVLCVDGTDVVISRSYSEKWSKPRGSAEKILTGHTTTYTVDGQLYTQRDFSEYINSLCSESLFMATTSPTYFVNLKADQQRSILTQMVGEVSPASVAAGKQEFQALLQIMGEQEIEKFRQHLSYQMKEIKAELERIPVRISEQRNDIANITPAEPTDWAKVEGDIKATEAAIKRIADAIAETIADSTKTQETELAQQRAARQQVREQITKAQDELDGIRSKHQQAVNKASMEASQRETQRLNAIAAAERAVQDNAQQLTWEETAQQATKQAVAQLAVDREAFIERWNATDASVLVFDENQFVCPTCKRPLEAEDVEAMKAKMLANFNADKARKLDGMEVEAAQLKTRDSQLAQQLAQHAVNVQELRDAQPQLQKALQDARTAQPASIEAQTLESLLANDAQYQQLKNATIPQLQAQLDAMPLSVQAGDTQAAVQGLQGDQQQLQVKLDSLKALAQVGTTIANKHKRITELEKQEQELNAQLTKLEGEDYTAEQLLQATIEELERKVNALFGFVSFTMFDHKINGALKPICECTVRGVPYSDLNNADRINAGIDIINSLCRHRGVYAPCFIDNAESINEVLPMHSQRIDLIVSTDTELNIVSE